VDLPILDRARLELITRGNAALADEFLGVLFEEARDLTEKLGALLGSEDRLAVSNAAHTIKGMAAELGALQLRAAAAALEAEGEPARWPDAVNDVNAKLAELRAHLDGSDPRRNGAT
jgi:HPt (histidine-containing phosphotransfer) domain-containing protein